MIGTWRWFLALLVVLGHLYVPWWPASYGVFSFYIISGFLMTLILDQRYGFSADGFRRFWINRVLRLFPTYYLACLFSIVIILSLPSEYVTDINTKFSVPDNLYDIFKNLFIVGLKVDSDSNLVPPAWALWIELFYYFVISVWAGRSRRNALIFLALGFAYLVYVKFALSFDFRTRYFELGAGALPFSIGVNLYFNIGSISERIDRIGRVNCLVVALALYFSCFLGAHLIGYRNTYFFYANLLTTTLLLSVLWNMRHGKLKRLDSLFGDFSYPTYLMHWQVGLLVAYTTDIKWGTANVFVVSVIIVTIISYLDSVLLSPQVNAIRNRFRNRASVRPGITGCAPGEEKA